MELRTPDGLQAALNEEINWRKKEIITLNLNIKGAKKDIKPVLLRASVPVLYAHFEGFVKKSSEYYLEFINRRNLPYGHLKSNFIFLGFKGTIDKLYNTNKTKYGGDLIDVILSIKNKTSNIPSRNSIKTESNLTAAVFCNIRDTLGIENDFYSEQIDRIVINLVHRRNKISHGDFDLINEKDWQELLEDVLKIMDRFKADIEDSVTYETYRA